MAEPICCCLSQVISFSFSARRCTTLIARQWASQFPPRWAGLPSETICGKLSCRKWLSFDVSFVAICFLTLRASVLSSVCLAFWLPVGYKPQRLPWDCVAASCQVQGLWTHDGPEQNWQSAEVWWHLSVSDKRWLVTLISMEVDIFHYAK